MRRKIVAGNWKMNLDVNEAETLFKRISSIASARNKYQKTLVFPPNIYIHSLLKENNGAIEIGAQNFHFETKGAFTGEVSAPQLKALGCSWVLIGHSERRVLFNEGAAILSKKMDAALESNLQVIYCCGESLREREQGNHFDKVRDQIAILKSLTHESMQNISIAYEPIWAIGTGRTASPAQAAEMHDFIRAELEAIFGYTIAESTSLLYGGSCSEENAKELFSCKNIDGGLIGGASLKVDSFGAIISAIE